MRAAPFILSIILCLAIHLPAQQKITKFDPSKPLNQSAINQWTTDQGLISNNLVNIMQSRDGYLWIATYDGLLRFDGITFEVFNKTNVSFLKSNAFYKAVEDGQGNLWFATQGTGLATYRNNKVLPAFEKLELPKSIRCILPSSIGDMWIGSNNNGLFILRDSAIVSMDHPALRDILIMSLAEDAAKKIWAATNGNGLIHINGDRITQYKTNDGLLSNIVNVVHIAANGDVLIGTVNGLNILSNGKISSIKITEGLQVSDIETDAYGSIWVSTERGLVRINKPLGIEEILSVDQGLPALSLTSITFDREGNLWLTTNKAGLVRLKDTAIKTFHKAHGLSLDLINVLHESQGKIYVGTDGGDIDVYENGKFHNIKLLHPFKNIGIRAIRKDSQGNLWIGSYNGLIKKTDNSEIVFNNQSRFPSQDVRRILEDKQHNIWVATRSAGVIKLYNDKVQKVFNLTSGLKSNYILSMEADAFGNIFLGTNGGGLSIINSDNTVRTFNIGADDSGVLIFNIHINDDGSAWLVTTTGIYLFDGSKFRQLTLPSSQIGESYFDWIEDDRDDVWITTNKGVLQIKKQEVMAFKNGRTISLKPRLYDNNDGMRNKECTSTMRSIKTLKGEIWVPTIGGIVVINPQSLEENPIVPHVNITRLVTDDSTFTNEKKIEIKPGNLRYTFHFTSLSLVAPSKNQFKYKLDGIDQDWVDSKSLREVTYTNLAPSQYIFHVLGSNNDGVWNETGATIQFEVKPFYYQTYTFYGAMMVLAFSILFGIYKWRVYDIESRNRELRKVNSELDKFVYSASHDLRAPLASVLGVVNVARLDKDESNRDKYLSLIEKSVHKLDGFISDIINFSRNARLEVKQSEIDFEKMINEILEDLKYLDESNRISRRVSSVGTGRFYSDAVRLKIILSNLISNAFKYHDPNNKSPFIEVKIKYDSEKAFIKVIDNGFGIASHHIDNIFKMFYRANENSKGSGIGLYIVKETLDKINGKIKVESKLGQGTEFEIEIPSGK